MLVFAALLLSAVQVASSLADVSIPAPLPKALVGAWMFVGWHTLLIGSIAIAAIINVGPWTRPVLLLLATIAAADVLWMIAFAGVRVFTCLLAFPPICFLWSWRALSPRDVIPGVA